MSNKCMSSDMHQTGPNASSILRRTFLKMVGLALPAGFTSKSPADAFGIRINEEKSKRKQIFLKENWFVKRLNPGGFDISSLMIENPRIDSSWLSARMPAQIHDILLRHKQISDPRVGKNAAESAWIGEEDWAYQCKFKSPENLDGPVFLQFNGLDTVADVYLNGKKIGHFENMFRTYRIEVTNHLINSGDQNSLLIVFYSPIRFLDRLRQLPEYRLQKRTVFPIRKPKHDFTDYLGAKPHSVKMGVYREILLDIPERAWIEDYYIRSHLDPTFKKAEIEIRITLAGEKSLLKWICIDPNNKPVDQGQVRVEGRDAFFKMTIKNPLLWWPYTHGSPSLYRIELTLINNGRSVDKLIRQFGVRSIEPVLEDQKTGEKRFQFKINGQEIFLRGANWVQVDGITNCWDQSRALQLLNRAEWGNMNLLRVWGGGYYPPEEFYEECDRRGILVWQDFMFSIGMDPAGFPELENECKIEIESIIKKLRNHACLLLWCGGNELFMSWYNRYELSKPFIGERLFKNIMTEACHEFDPDRYYHINSPYGGDNPNSANEGDWHDYSAQYFLPGSELPLFPSEIGRVSTPSLSSMKNFLSNEELWPSGFNPAIRHPGDIGWPPMWSYRSATKPWEKCPPIGQYCDPESAEDLIRILGTSHGEYLRDRIERQRRGVPDGAPDGSRRCWGNMVWRLNDAWPTIYWSVIDYYLQPKIAFYYLRRTYSPVLLSFERTHNGIWLWLINDSSKSVQGTIIVEKKRFSGTVRSQMKKEFHVKPGQSKRCLDLNGLGRISRREEFLHATFDTVESICLLGGERDLKIPEATITPSYSDETLHIKADTFVRQASILLEPDSKGWITENYFDMLPDKDYRVKIKDLKTGEKIRIKGLNTEPVEVSV